MSGDDDIDRAAILARRQQFIAVTLAVLGTGCRPLASDPPELRCARCEANLERVPGSKGIELNLDDESDCHAEVLRAVRAAHARSPSRAAQGLAMDIGEHAYATGDLATARESFEFFIEHFDDHVEDAFDPIPRRYYRLAKRYLRDIEAGRPWSGPYHDRFHRPQVCLRRSSD